MFVARVGPVNMPAEGDTIAVYETGTTDTVSICDLDGVLMSNPFTVTADAIGQWAFVPVNAIRLDVYWDEQGKNLMTNVQLKGEPGPAGEDGADGADGADAVYSDETPEAPGSADPGVLDEASRADHVHPAQDLSSYAPKATPSFTGAMTYEAAKAAFSDAGNMGASETFDFATKTNFKGTLDADCAITVSNLANGQRGQINLRYSGAQRTLTWTGVGAWLTDEPTSGPASGKILVVSLSYDGTTVIGAAKSS
jgi:hypothetical protein